MAVYQGARPRAGLDLPWLRPGWLRPPSGDPQPAARRSGRPLARPAARRASRSAAISRRRIGGQRRVAMSLAGIVVVFSVAFVSLSQSVRVAATSYDIVRLQSENDRLSALQQDLRSDVERLRGEPAIRKEALDAGLGQLGAPVVLPVR
jgi:cell division protein FtsB